VSRAAASVDLFGLLANQHDLRVTSSFVMGGGGRS
jgi:hypothetical protein